MRKEKFVDGHVIQQLNDRAVGMCERIIPNRPAKLIWLEFVEGGRYRSTWQQYGKELVIDVEPMDWHELINGKTVR